MFEKQYRFYGSHAEKVSALTAIFDEDSKAKLFDRNLDVYINAPLIGFLYNKQSQRDRSDSANNIAPQNIFPEQMMNASDKLKYIFRLILILDTKYEPNEENRLDKAFRKFGTDEKDIALFDSYVLGGVDILYEKLIEGANNPTEYVDRMYDFVEEFHDRFNDGITSDEILALCRTNN
ncbi:MAG: hypothetical protein ACM3X1_05210 [Ignavibacteriales bacterium]